MAKGEVLEVEQEPKALELRQPSMMDLIQVAIQNNSAMDVIERLTALQEKQMAREAESDFNEALNRVQEKIKRIAPDLDNPQTRSRYASYAAIDRKIRPIYAAEGFSLSFNTADCPIADHVRVTCRVALRGHKEMYQVDMPADGKGAKGGDVMTKTHATGAAMQYGMRYLVKYIFNIAIGDEDTDGNATNGDLSEAIEWLTNARSPEELKKLYADAYNKFESSPAAIKALINARNKKREEF